MTDGRKEGAGWAGKERLLVGLAGDPSHLAPWEPWSKTLQSWTVLTQANRLGRVPPNPTLTVELGYNLDENIQGSGAYESTECGGVPKAHSCRILSKE